MSENIYQGLVTSNFVSRWLRYLGVVKLSKWYYEWNGELEVSKTKDDSEWYFVDSINAYSEKELDEMLPKNVAVNENVTEISYRPEDSMAEKKGKLLVWLLEKNMLTGEADWYRPDIRANHEKYEKEPEILA